MADGELEGEALCWNEAVVDTDAPPLVVLLAEGPRELEAVAEGDIDAEAAGDADTVVLTDTSLEALCVDEPLTLEATLEHAETEAHGDTEEDVDADPEALWATETVAVPLVAGDAEAVVLPEGLLEVLPSTGDAVAEAELHLEREAAPEDDAVALPPVGD